MFQTAGYRLIQVLFWEEKEERLDAKLFARLIDFAPLRRNSSSVVVELVSRGQPYRFQRDEYLIVRLTMIGWFMGWIDYWRTYRHFIRMAAHGRRHASTATVEFRLMAAPDSQIQAWTFRRAIMFQYTLDHMESLPDVIPPGVGYEDAGLRKRGTTLAEIMHSGSSKTKAIEFRAR